MKFPRTDLWTGYCSMSEQPASVKELAQLKAFITAGSVACALVFFFGVWLLAGLHGIELIGLAVMAAGCAGFYILARSTNNFDSHSNAQSDVLTRFVRERILPESGIQYIRKVAELGRELSIAEASQLIELGQSVSAKRKREELYAVVNTPAGEKSDA